jgi:hypothetical protein
VQICPKLGQLIQTQFCPNVLPHGQIKNQNKKRQKKKKKEKEMCVCEEIGSSSNNKVPRSTPLPPHGWSRSLTTTTTIIIIISLV